jgi:hypothetical protein
MEAGASHLVAVLAADSVDIDSALALMASVIGDSTPPLDSIYLTPSFRSRMSGTSSASLACIGKVVRD